MTATDSNDEPVRIPSGIYADGGPAEVVLVTDEMQQIRERYWREQTEGSGHGKSNLTGELAKIVWEGRQG